MLFILVPISIRYPGHPHQPPGQSAAVEFVFCYGVHLAAAPPRPVAQHDVNVRERVFNYLTISSPHLYNG